jgi:O-antigen/teichoic acid export membrane protein
MSDKIPVITTKIMSNPLWRLAKNFTAMLLVRGGDMIYAFLSMAILARYFGPSLYGDYVFIISFIFIFNPLINFGIPPIMVRELAVHKAAGGDYFGSGLAFRLLMAAFALIIILGIFHFLGLNQTQQLALLIFVISEFSWLACGIFGEVFIAFERMEIGTYISAINRGLSLFLLLAISYFDFGFLAVFIALGIINFLSLIAAVVVVRDNFLAPRLVWHRELLNFWFKAAWAMAIASVIMQCFLRVDVYILRIFRNPAEIAYFEAPYKIIAHTYFISAAIAIAFAPAFARTAQNNIDQFRPILEQCLKILLIIVLPLTAGAVILGPHLIVPLMGPKFVPAEAAMALLSFCIPLAFFEPLLTAVLISIKRTGVVLVIHLLALGVDLLLDIYWIPQYGFLGACYANLAAYGIIFFISFVSTYYFVGGFSLVKVAGRTLPVGLLIAAGLYCYSLLASWQLMSPQVFVMVGIFLTLLLYPLLLVISRTITQQDLAVLKQAMEH